METVTERSTAYLTVVFSDKAGAPAAPASVTYRVDDVDSGTNLREKTSLSPSAQIEITLNVADNTILNDALSQEIRRVTVEAKYAADDEINEAYDYILRNLRFIP